MNNMKKELLKFGIIFFVTIAVVLWGLNFIFFNKNAPKSKASGETMSLTFDPSTKTIDARKIFSVSLMAKPSINTVIRGYKVRLNFDKTKLRLRSIVYKTGVVSVGIGNTTADIAKINADGTFVLVGEDHTATGYTLGSANGVELASLSFTVLTAEPNIIQIVNPIFYSVNENAVLTSPWTYAATGLSVNGGVIPTPTGTTPPVCESFSDDFSGTTINANNWNLWTDNAGTAGFTTPAGEVTLFLPASTVQKGVIFDSFDKHNIGAGADFVAELTMKSISATESKKYAVSIFSIAANSNDNRHIDIMRYSDSGRLSTTFQNVAGSTTPQVFEKEIGLSNTMPVKVKIEKIGTIVKTYYDLLDGNGYQLLKQFENFYSAENRIYFGIPNGPPDFPQASANFDDFKLTCSAVPLPSTIVSQSPTGGPGNVKLNLKLKFQGISKKPDDKNNYMDVKVTVKKDGITASEQVLGLTADESGIWSRGPSGFPGLTAGSGYTVLVKGPFHIQKKVCVATPTETAGGTYKCSNGQISLVDGDNTLDFSGILQLTGDLPEQNGTVDAYDISLVRNCIGKTDETCLNNADVNRDGKVNTQDYSLIIASLSVKSDEE